MNGREKKIETKQKQRIFQKIFLWRSVRNCVTNFFGFYCFFFERSQASRKFNERIFLVCFFFFFKKKLLSPMRSANQAALNTCDIIHRKTGLSREKNRIRNHRKIEMAPISVFLYFIIFITQRNRCRCRRRCCFLCSLFLCGSLDYNKYANCRWLAEAKL